VQEEQRSAPGNGTTIRIMRRCFFGGFVFVLCVCVYLECPQPAARSLGETWRWNVLRQRK